MTRDHKQLTVIAALAVIAVILGFVINRWFAALAAGPIVILIQSAWQNHSRVTPSAAATSRNDAEDTSSSQHQASRDRETRARWVSGIGVGLWVALAALTIIFGWNGVLLPIVAFVVIVVSYIVEPHQEVTVSAPTTDGRVYGASKAAIPEFFRRRRERASGNLGHENIGGSSSEKSARGHRTGRQSKDASEAR